MILFESRIEGIKTEFGYVRDLFEPFSCHFCTNFEYDEGKFDSILYRKDGETIYLRIPFRVIDGELDHYSAYIQFGRPFVIKHVVNLGLDYDENSLLTASGGLSQFQDPLDKDGEIRDKSRWVKAGEEKIKQLLSSMNDELVS